MKNKKKYDKLRDFVIEQGVAKIEARSYYRHKDAEVLMLAMDLLSCPFVGAPHKQRVADVYAMTPTDVSNIGKSSKNWFTTWSGADIAEELDAKRRREVY